MLKIKRLKGFGKLCIVHCALCIGVAVALSSCNTQGCTDNRSAIPLAEFYSYSANQAITLDSVQIHGIGAPGDSLLIGAGERVSQVYLPMRSDFTSTAWCLSYRWKALDYDALNDTLTFNYTSEPWFAGSECGAMYRYHIDSFSYTRHLIDSVAVMDSLITNVDKAQIRVYFRTADPDTTDQTRGGGLSL